MSVKLRGGVYWIDVTVGPHRVKHSSGSSDKKEAETLELEVRLALKNGSYKAGNYLKRQPEGRLVVLSPQISTVGQMLDTCMQRHWAYLRNTKRQQRLVNVLKRLVGHTKLTDMSSQWAFNLVDSLMARGISGGTCRKYIIYLSTAQNNCFRWGLIPHVVPLNTVRESLPKQRHRSKFFNDEEIAEIIQLFKLYPSTLNRPASASACHRLHLFFECLVETGARVTEINQVYWHEIDFEQRLLRLSVERSKSKTARTVALSARVLEIFQQLKDQGLPRPFNISWRVLDRSWKFIRQRMGREDDPDFVRHLARHAFGTKVYQLSGDIRLTQRAMGHNHLVSTLRYEHAVNDAGQRAVQLLEAAKLFPKVVP